MVKKFIGAFKEAWAKATNTEMREAVQNPSLDNSDIDEYKYRKITGKVSRDLTPIKYNKAADLAYYLWQRNPLAKRLIEIMIDFCLGTDWSVDIEVYHVDKNGNRTKVENEKPQQVWNSFCNDPINNFYQDFPLLIQELFLCGELLEPTIVNPINGDVRLGFIDAKLIEKSERNISGKGISKVTVTLDETSAGTKTLTVSNVDIDPNSPTYNRRVGEALYFRINRVLSQLRGHGELLQLLDWIDAFDQFLFNNLEGATFRNSFFYDVEMKDATQEQIDKTVVTPPKSGSVKLHNDKFKWNILSPNLQATDSATAIRMFKNFILAGVGYPEHWFSDGGNTNLSTAEKMSTPVMAMLKKKQGMMKQVVIDTAMYVFDQKALKNAKMLDLAEGDEIVVNVNMFDFNREDASVIASAFVQTVTALVTARDKGWVSDENAKKVVDGNLQRLGIKVNTEETPEDINNEDVYKDMPDSKKYLNNNQDKNKNPDKSKQQPEQ